jgi:competence protein ComEC
MRLGRLFFLALALLLAASLRMEAQQRGLDIYFVDTEGGAATLIVSPQGESTLIDCGNPGERDAGRIYHVAHDVAGLKALDNLVITHWHLDHYGGAGPLSKLMPIRHFYDRGIPAVSNDDPEHFPTLIAAYRTASRGKSVALKPGDTIPLKQKKGAPALQLACLCANREVIPDRPGAPENPFAKEVTLKDEDPGDNARSAGFLLRYGRFRFLDLGDLTWNIEAKLISPTDKIGPIDVYQATHHGLDISNNTALIKTVSPRVAIFSNGPHKGCNPSVVTTLRQLPDMQGIYQIHRNLDADEANTPDATHIANVGETCQAEFIKLAVAPDSLSYTVMVGSKGTPHRYETRP